MKYKSYCNSPLGKIILSADEAELTGLWFDKQKYFSEELLKSHSENDNDIIKCAKEWLKIYFSGQNPDFTPKLRFTGTPFQVEVWNLLLKIPYGKTISYGDIAKEIAQNKNLEKMSAQAVGGAVGRNKISIIVPCHRVLGANSTLTGYAGGLNRKKQLLELENIRL